MDVWDAIQRKRAVRDFADKPLPEDVLERILRAGRRSQSSKNTQPWHFIVVRDRERRQRLSQAGTYLSPVTKAAACVVFVTENLPAEDSNWVAFDVGQCAAYMQLAATELGVGSVIGTLHKPDIAREILGLPENMRSDVLLSFGYPSEQEQARPRGKPGRRPLDDIVHWETW